MNSKVDTGLDNLGKRFWSMVGKQFRECPKGPIKEYIVRNKTGFDAVFRTIATVMETQRHDGGSIDAQDPISLQQLMVKKVVKAMWQEWVATDKLVKRLDPAFRAQQSDK